MVLTTSKRITLIALICFCAIFRSAAQDSSWYYANTIRDYASADMVCLVSVGETKILDSIGGYTVQEVTFEPIQFYKSKTESRKFRAWLESREVVWKPGTIRGYYLLKGKPDSADNLPPGHEMYYWLENAGFAASDTTFITMLSDSRQFKKMVEKYIFPDISATWIKATILNVTGESDKGYGGINVTIRLEQELPSLNLHKGQTIPVTIWNSPHKNKEELMPLLQKGGKWDFALYREDGVFVSNAEFMLPDQ